MLKSHLSATRFMTYKYVKEEEDYCFSLSHHSWKQADKERTRDCIKSEKEFIYLFVECPLRQNAILKICKDNARQIFFMMLLASILPSDWLCNCDSQEKERILMFTVTFVLFKH